MEGGDVSYLDHASDCRKLLLAFDACACLYVCSIRARWELSCLELTCAGFQEVKRSLSSTIAK